MKANHSHPMRRGTLALALGVLLSFAAACQDGAEPSVDVAASGSAAPSPAPAPVGGTDSGAAAPDRIDLAQVGYDRGSDNAPLTVIEFSDFGCPFCGMFARSTYPELHREFVQTGKVRWKYVPFVMGMFPNGAEAARAAECAAEQERFWPMHDRLFEKQNEWKSTRHPTDLFQSYAQSLGLDEAAFASCYREDRGGERTRAANWLADQMGVRATPSFVIGGRMIEGALPVEQFRAVLNQLSSQEPS